MQGSVIMYRGPPLQTCKLNLLFNLITGGVTNSTIVANCISIIQYHWISLLKLNLAQEKVFVDTKIASPLGQCSQKQNGNCFRSESRRVSQVYFVKNVRPLTPKCVCGDPWLDSLVEKSVKPTTISQYLRKTSMAAMLDEATWVLG